MLMKASDCLRTHGKQIMVHGLILFGFLFYCIFVSGPLFDRFDGNTGESKLQHISLPVRAESMHYAIDSVRGVGTSVIEVLGWAFIDGQSSENNYKYVVLKSDKDCYVFDTIVVGRPDVTSFFNSLNLDLGLSGFVCNIPVRKIGAGEYLLGIYVREGDIEALQFSDRAIVKSGGTMRFTYWTSSLQRIALPEESGNITFAIDTLAEPVEDETAIVDVAGWAFIQAYSTENSRIYLVLESSSSVYVFDTLVRMRPDVTQAFQALGLNLDSSGFTAKIRKEAIEDGLYRIGIYIKGNNVDSLRFTGRSLGKSGDVIDTSPLSP